LITEIRKAVSRCDPTDGEIEINISKRAVLVLTLGRTNIGVVNDQVVAFAWGNEEEISLEIRGQVSVDW